MLTGKINGASKLHFGISSTRENSVATSLSTKAQVANWLSYGSDKNPYGYSQVFSKN